MPVIESSSWPGAPLVLTDGRRMGGWDEVLCGDRIDEALESDELSQLLFSPCAARYAFRTFAGADELYQRLGLMTRFYDQPMAFEPDELRALATRYTAQMRPFAQAWDSPELLAMIDNPIVFEDVGQSIMGEGNQLWDDVIGAWYRDARKALPKPLAGETDTLVAMLSSRAWFPPLTDALISPLLPIEGYDPGLYLQCWIRNAAVVIDEDAIRVSRRIEGR